MQENIIPHNFSVDLEQLKAIKNHNAFLIWFTGLSGSGKSTIANALNQLLLEKKVHTCILDGDSVRKGLNQDLTFSPEDRRENIRRIAEVANLMITHAGLVVLGAFISPYESDRTRIKEIVGEDKFIEVYISTTLEECEKRDVKGLYKKARAGEIKDFTGIDAPYEVPQYPSIEIDASKHTVEEASLLVLTYIESKLITNG
ncbi:adenylyl-sulfate kinase [uncultured Dokdonia sp.]|uniref:adenylyl-sulfate kinase n=1 Tax=uncultured Dokdonia sp. TaxID=575653 RepID=UPI00262AF72C|nr:adenylyl-sulfate kinase [uncultured Dokdonia sp.]